jgi:hypothetical protein
MGDGVTRPAAGIQEGCQPYPSGGVCDAYHVAAFVRGIVRCEHLKLADGLSWATVVKEPCHLDACGDACVEYLAADPACPDDP